MRKLWKIFLLAGVLCAILCVGTLAAESSGVYDVQTSTGYTLTPQTATKENITQTSVTINGASEAFYANAERFVLTGPSVAGNQYLVLALNAEGTPTENNIAYIDQNGATDTTIAFNVYPNKLTNGTTYRLYMVGTGADEAYKQVASFTYYAPYVLGDVNSDGKIDTSDALLVLQYAAEKVQLTDTQKLSADVAVQKGKIDTSDALRILQYAAEKISSFD